MADAIDCPGAMKCSNDLSFNFGLRIPFRRYFVISFENGEEEEIQYLQKMRRVRWKPTEIDLPCDSDVWNGINLKTVAQLITRNRADQGKTRLDFLNEVETFNSSNLSTFICSSLHVVRESGTHDLRRH
jgi:hypothetical protein